MQRAHEVLDYVGLSEARYRRVESYSTGMKQRLKLASAIVHDPKLLILDEPTNGMDPAGRDEVLQLARDLAHNKGMSLLFSSHLLPDVESVCDHVMVMGAGRLLTQGNIKEMKGLQQLLYDVRLKADPDRFSARLTAVGCEVERRDGDLLVVKVPAGRDHKLLWEIGPRRTIANSPSQAAPGHAGRRVSQSHRSGVVFAPRGENVVGLGKEASYHRYSKTTVPAWGVRSRPD